MRQSAPNNILMFGGICYFVIIDSEIGKIRNHTCSVGHSRFGCPTVPSADQFSVKTSCSFLAMSTSSEQLKDFVFICNFIPHMLPLWIMSYLIC